MNQNQAENRYYGKYQGFVFNNVDPENRGRIQATVPDIQGTLPLSYAKPSLPYAGMGSGSFFVPEVGSNVWIEFEQGNPDYPIWSGCFWGSAAELPEGGLKSLPASPNISFQTKGKNSITISGLPGGGIVLSNGLLSQIQISEKEILIQCGKAKILLESTGAVTINEDALEIDKLI
jgi:hypothetical protein